MFGNNLIKGFKHVRFNLKYRQNYNALLNYNILSNHNRLYSNKVLSEYKNVDWDNERGIKLDGRKLAREIRTRIKNEVKTMQKFTKGTVPGLAIVQVGTRGDSTVYVRMKKKAARDVGFNLRHCHLPFDTTEAELLSMIEKLNNDSEIHGILVQLPLPEHISEESAIEAIASQKDVDGFGSWNAGRLAQRNVSPPHFVPCTPRGCIELMDSAGISIEGKHAVVIGRSNIVGTPVSHLLSHRNATVTVCHSKTTNLQEIVRQGDIIIAAAGRPEMITGDWLKEGCIVIDVGINQIPDDKKKTGRRMVGDVHYESAVKVAGAISPVPGGVGPMTVTMLLDNTLISARKFVGEYGFVSEEDQRWKLRPVNISHIKSLFNDTVPSDMEIAELAQCKPITQLGAECRLIPSEIHAYGKYKAKIDLSVLNRLTAQSNGNYVLVAGITPTPLGEGKSTTVIGLVQALSAHLGKNSFACVRQPSQGPTFGIKGGAAGGGFSQIVPMDEFNLHLTGDIHAIAAATNLLAAAVDARLFHENTQKDEHLFDRLCPKKGESQERKFSKIMLRRLQRMGIHKSNPELLTDEERHRFIRLNIDPNRILVRRVVDVNDRFLREIEVGRGAAEKGYIRTTGFDITVASELMAIMALSTSLKDMGVRIGRMVIAFSVDGDPITCDDIGITGALLVILKDTIEPTMMQTLEGTPVLVHAGPFANIAHGNSSIVADLVALKLVTDSGYVVTEAGFGADIGMEKFFNIKCRTSGLQPNCVVLVATIRAIKMHGFGPNVVAGRPLPNEYTSENLELVKQGCSNVIHQINIAKRFGIPVVVCINRFATDTDAEHDIVIEKCLEAGAFDCVVSQHFDHGGSGAIDLAASVVAACSKPSHFKYLYDLNDPIIEKIRTIAIEVYNANDIELSELAQQQIQQYEKAGYGNLPICMAKTHLSLSHDPKWKGVPSNFVLPIREVRASIGAGFLYPLVGTMSTMPGLPTRPSYYDIDIDPETNVIRGLF